MTTSLYIGTFSVSKCQTEKRDAITVDLNVDLESHCRLFVVILLTAEEHNLVLYCGDVRTKQPEKGTKMNNCK